MLIIPCFSFFSLSLYFHIVADVVGKSPFYVLVVPFATNMDYIGLIIGFIAGACGSLILWITIGRKMMLKYAGESVINALKEPTPKLKQAISGLMEEIWIWLNAPTIEAESKNEDGEAVKIKISPMQNTMSVLINDVSNKLLNKLRGFSGAAARDGNRVEAALMGIPLPRKGQTTQEFILEQLANRMMPIIEQKLSKTADNTQGGSGKSKDGW